MKTPTTATLEKEALAAVDLARNPNRPRTLRVIETAFTDWTELKGDRLFGDDRALIGGVGRLDSRWVIVLGQEKKGTDAMTRSLHNFGMPHPEGYRKAQRLMRLAEKFNLPLICLVDTPAAYAGVGAEERGQAWAIASSLLTMLDLHTPIISVILSEGGSGGALALCLGDRVLALENAIYTVAPPETCAAILYRDASQSGRAAAAMKPGVATAVSMGLVDEIIPEPSPGAHAHPEIVIAALKGSLLRHLDDLSIIDNSQIVTNRQSRYRNLDMPRE